MVVGILTLIFYNDLTVKDYFASLNGQSNPVVRVPYPVIIEAVEEYPAVEEPPNTSQEVEEPKAKKKPVPRKVA